MESAQTLFPSLYNFIINFKPEEIDDVIADFKLRHDGYRIFYAVDTYDIIFHYLPYTDGGFFRYKDKNELAQKIICYDYFFSLKEREKNDPSSDQRINERNKSIIILNEYKIELLAAKNKIFRQLKDMNNIIKNLEYLKKETFEFRINNKDANAYFEKNFELILLLLILSEKKNFIHLEFEDFIKNRISILEINSGSLEDDQILNRIFSNAGHTDLSLQLFDTFIQENKYDLISIEKEIDRFVYLENTFRDVQAIDRVININTSLTTEQEKYVVLYLSSAPYKTKELFKCLNIISQKDEPKSNYRTAINRNIYQCFLFEMLSNEFYENKPDVFKALQSLKKLTNKFEVKEQEKVMDSDSLKEDDIIILNKLKGIFDIYSASLDNHFYIKIYEKYKDLYNSVSSTDQKRGVRLKKDIDLMPIFSLIDNFINREGFKQKYFDFTFTVNHLKYYVEISDFLSKSNPVRPSILFGKDIIKNSFHHLPYLLFLYEDNNLIIRRLSDLLNTLIDISYSEHPLLPELTPKLKKVIVNLVEEQKDINLMVLQQIIISYINLITTNKNLLPKDEEDKEVEIIETLERQKEILRHIKFDTVLNESHSNLEMLFRPFAFAKEIDYILLWLYRRNKKLDKGIEFGKDLVKQFPEDPRYYHGLGLNYISKAYENVKSLDIAGKEFIILSDLKNAFLYLRYAKERYEELMGLHQEENYGMLIIKNYIAVLNSLADISIRVYEIESFSDISRVQDARLLLDQAKLIFNQTGMIYNNYPVLNATEVEIEYFEARDLHLNKKYSEAHQKILNALNRQAILDANIFKTPIDSRFLDIKKQIQKLSVEIFRNVGRR